VSGRPLLLGHRGARAVKSIPENTLASFDRALADGCDGFEFDVRITADGQAVVCHDAKVGNVEIATAARDTVEALPGLQEVLQRYQQSAFLDIELKVPGLEEITLALLARFRPRRGFVVSSFFPEVLQTLHAQDSTVALGVICEHRAELGRWRELPVEYVIVQWKLVTRGLLDEIKAAKRKAIVWTVNEQGAMKRFAGWRVDGIISDDTRLLAESLESEKK
jgi:glycerophosphoryl diester phosphodiesterase